MCRRRIRKQRRTSHDQLIALERIEQHFDALHANRAYEPTPYNIEMETHLIENLERLREGPSNASIYTPTRLTESFHFSTPTSSRRVNVRGFRALSPNNILEPRRLFH
jgi:hypothetical protein